MFAEDVEVENSTWGFPFDIFQARKFSTAMTIEEEAIYRQQGIASFPFPVLTIPICSFPSEITLNLSLLDQIMNDTNLESEFDCGIACVRMLYGWSQESFIPTEEIARIKTPLWTIDLMEQLLMASSLDCHMYTLALGVQEYHADIEWYEKCNSKGDETRIQSLFKKCVDNKWPVHKGKVSMATIIQLLEKGCIIILLVNSVSLSIERKPKSTENYVGHFIVVTSYDKKFRKFFYLDPSKTSGSYNFLFYHICSFLAFIFLISNTSLSCLRRVGCTS